MGDRDDAELRARGDAELARVRAEWACAGGVGAALDVRAGGAEPRRRTGWKLAVKELARRGGTPAPPAPSSRRNEAYEAERASRGFAAELLIAIGHPLGA